MKRTTQRLVDQNVRTHVFTEQASKEEHPQSKPSVGTVGGVISGIAALAAQLMALIGL